MLKYHVRESQVASDHNAPLAVWIRNFPGVDFSKRYDWYYRNHPYGVYSYLLTDDNETAIGAAGLSARTFHHAGETRLVGLCSDFSVDADNRFLGPALHLQRNVVTKGLERFPFVYGFPNDRAVGVMARVGYRPLGPVANYTLVLRSGYYFVNKKWAPVLAAVIDAIVGIWIRAISFLAPIRDLQETSAIDGRFDELWRATPKAMFTAVRDARFLRWRFLNHPIERFRFFVLPDEYGALRGYAVIAVEKSGQWRIVDFLAGAGRGALRNLLVGVVRRAFDEGANSLNLEFFGQVRVHRTLRSIGFFRRPHWRRIVAATRDQTQASHLRAQSNWYITSADED